MLYGLELRTTLTAYTVLTQASVSIAYAGTKGKDRWQLVKATSRHETYFKTNITVLSSIKHVWIELKSKTKLYRRVFLVRILLILPIAFFQISVQYLIDMNKMLNVLLKDILVIKMKSNKNKRNRLSDSDKIQMKTFSKKTSIFRVIPLWRVCFKMAYQFVFLDGKINVSRRDMMGCGIGRLYFIMYICFRNT